MPPTNPPPTGAVTYSQQYRRCGKPDCQVCRPGLPGHGPYWYARWQEGGRTRTRYIGKEAPPGVSDRALPAVPKTTVAVEGKDVGGQAQSGAPCRRAGAGKTAALSGLAPTPAPPALRVRTLGGFTVWRGDRELAPGCWSRRTVAALFKCLLTAPGQRLTREQAADLLWPDADRDQSGVNLRAAIHRLRAVLDEPGTATSYLRSVGAALILDPHPGSLANQDQDWLDADAFARAARLALAGGDITTGQAALDLYGGAYLPDDPYEDWAAARREELRQQYHALLLQLARLSADAGDSAGAVWRLRLLLAADPCHEPATRLLMRLLAATGDRAEALRAYEALVRALRDDLDVVPTPETKSLHATLRAAVASLPAVAVPRTEPQPTPTNLPATLTSFVGRGRELAALGHALAQGPVGCRLLTLTGLGGCGKTRLVLRVAADSQAHYPDGVWLIELAALADPALVAGAVAAVLGVREAPDEPVLTTLADALQPRRLLLVLDNCEHLVAACADVAATLLRACPHLQILATSREALGMAGEVVWRVPSLALPPITDALRAAAPAVAPTDAPAGSGGQEGILRLDRLERFEAVQLFLARARAARPDFALSAHNAFAVVDVCRRLDGLPLAIELAAARLGALSVQEVAARLDDCFGLLKTGNRAALPCHQTLRGVLDWSYTLLSLPEQALLRRLAVFAGGWTLAAAETVCAGGVVRADEVLDLLASLEAKSLVVLADSPAGGSTAIEDGESRYGFLETVRQYALAHLEEGGAVEETRLRFARHYLALAETAEPELVKRDQVAWLARLDAEHDNMRAALARVGATVDTPAAASASASASMEWAALGLRLVAALWWYWFVRDYLSEGRRWLEGTLALDVYRGHDAETGDAADRTRATRAKALRGAAILASQQGDYGRAGTLLGEAIALSKAAGDRKGVAGALNSLGRITQMQGDYAHAAPLYEESLAMQRALGNGQGIAGTLNNLGLVAYMQGEHARAAALYEESLALKREAGHTQGIASSLSNLGNVALARGDIDGAAALYEESLGLRRAVGDKEGMALTLDGLAAVAGAHGRPGLAARLIGAATTLRLAMGAPRQPPPSFSPHYEPTVAATLAALGEDRFTMLWREGQAMTLEEIIAYARKRSA